MSKCFRKPCGAGISRGSLLPEPGVGGCLALPDGWVTFPGSNRKHTCHYLGNYFCPHWSFYSQASALKSHRAFSGILSRGKGKLKKRGGENPGSLLHGREGRPQLQQMDHRPSEARGCATGTWIPEAWERCWVQSIGWADLEQSQNGLQKSWAGWASFPHLHLSGGQLSCSSRS